MVTDQDIINILKKGLRAPQNEEFKERLLQRCLEVIRENELEERELSDK